MSVFHLVAEPVHCRRWAQVHSWAEVADTVVLAGHDSRFAQYRMVALDMAAVGVHCPCSRSRQHHCE